MSESKQIFNISISDVCYETEFSCEHDCIITYCDGDVSYTFMDGKNLVDKYYEYLTRDAKKHLSIYKYE